MTRRRCLALCVIVAVGCQGQTPPTSSPPAQVEAPSHDPGLAVWAEGYPRLVPAANGAASAVEVFGTYEVRPGWTLKAAHCEFVPAGGGARSEPTRIAFADNRWGATDPEGKTGVTPARVPLGKGKWNVRVEFLFEGRDASGTRLALPYQTMTKTIEVK